MINSHRHMMALLDLRNFQFEYFFTISPFASYIHAAAYGLLVVCNRHNIAAKRAFYSVGVNVNHPRVQISHRRHF